MIGYGYNDNYINAQNLYDNVVTRYGFVNASPFVSDYNVTTPNTGAPQGLLGLGVGLLSQKLLGTSSIPFRLVNPWERPAGDLGAYGLSRFEGNTARMGAANSSAMAQRQAALGSVFSGGLGEQIFGKENAAKVAATIRNDRTGIADMFASQAARFFGAGQDYGVTAINAAKHAEALMTDDERRALNNTEYGSEQWKSLINNSSSRFTKAARSLMYERDGNSFVRKEDFMRGFSETDVSSLLERVVASASGNEDMKSRMQTVGKEAIGTLEAFKELFGSAERAKQVMNAITGGGFASMTEQDFARLTNTTRGLMDLGNKAGVSNTAVAGMIETASQGVTGAMGYTAADIAGGFVNNKYVGSVAGQFVAQELKNMGAASLSDLDPTTQARIQAQATWRATQFAGSSANKYMTAAVYAKKNGIISAESYERAKNLFASGDEQSMQQGAQIIASAMNMSQDEILDPTHFRIFADDVASDSESLSELVDLGVSASNKEDRNRTEKAVADVGLERAQRAANIAGVSDSDQNSITSGARLASIRENLAKFAKNGDQSAEYVMQAMSHAGNDPDEQLRVFENMKDMLAPGVGDYADANATAAAANALNDRAYGTSEIGGGVAAAAARYGAKLNGNGELSRVDAGKIFQGLANAFEAEGSSDKAQRVNELLENGDFRTLDREFGIQFTNEQYAARGNTVLSNIGFADRPEEVKGASRQTFADILGNEDNKFKYEATRSGKTDTEAVNAATGAISKVIEQGSKDEELDKLKKSAEEAKTAQEEAITKANEAAVAAGKFSKDDTSEEAVKARKEKEKAFKAMDSAIEASKKADQAVEARQAHVDSRSEKIKPLLEQLQSAETPEQRQAALEALDEFTSNKENAEVVKDLRNAASEGNRVVFSGNISDVQESISLNGNKLNLSDEKIAAAVTDAAKGTSIAGQSAEYIMNAITSNGVINDEERAKIRGELGRSNLLIERDRGEATGDAKLTEQAGAADMANRGFDGAMVAVSKFEGAIKDLGTKADVTTKQLTELGEAVTAIVDANENRNKSVVQSVAQWAEARTDEEKNAASEALRGSLMNPGMSQDVIDNVLDKISTMLDGVSEKFDISAITEKLETLANDIGESVASNLPKDD